MAQNQSITLRIGVEANLSALNAIEAELKRIKSNSKINFGTDATKNIDALESQLINLKNTLQTVLSGDQIDPKLFDKLKEPVQKLQKQLKTLKVDLADLSLPEDVKKDFDKLEREINDNILKIERLNDKMTALKKQASFNVDGSVALNQSEKNLIASSEANKARLVNPDTGHAISQYKTIEQVYKNIDKARTDLTDAEKKIIKTWESILQKIHERENDIKTSTEAIHQELQDTAKSIQDLKSAQSDLLNESDQSKSFNASIRSSVQNIDTLSENLNKASKINLPKYNDEQQESVQITAQSTKEVEKNRSTFGKAINNVINYGTAVNVVRNVYQGFIQTIKDLDQALTDMTVVTSLTREEAWQLTTTMQTLAKETGTTTVEVAKMTTLYLQQGKTLADSITLTEAAAKAAKIAGISGSDSVKLLTNAMNGFQMSADQAMSVSDKFAALAAASATDYEQLATALSKVASQANLAGMSMDFTLGMLAKGIEVTQEAPETIGTALKTVIARMRELTDYGETLEDGVDINRVEKALANINVDLRDQSGQFRDLEQVLTEVGLKWDKLNTNQRANVAVALAGTRQQSRLIAMMQDFERTQELVEISMSSAGATMAQHRKYMQGLEAATARTTTAYQGLITQFTNSDLAIGALNILSSTMEFLADNMGIVYGVMGGILAIYGPLLAQKAMDNVLSAAAQTWNLLNANAIEKEKEAQIEKNIAKNEEQQIINNTLIAKQNEIIQEANLAEAKNKTTLATINQSIATSRETQATIRNSIATKENAIANLQARQAKGEKGLEDELAIAQTELATEKTKLATAAEEEQNLILQKSEILQERIAINTTKANAEREKEALLIENTNLLTEAQNLLASQAIKWTKESITNKIKAYAYQQLVNNGMIAENAARLLGIPLKTADALAEQELNKETQKSTISLLAEAAAAIFNSGAKVAQTGATTGATVAQKGLNAAMKANPFIAVTAAILGLVVAVVAIASKSEELKEALQPIGETLLTLFDTVGSILTLLFNTIMPIVELLIGLVANSLMKSVKTSMAVWTPVLRIVQFLLSLLQILFDFQNAINEGFKSTVNNLIQGFADWFTSLEWVQNIIKLFQNFKKILDDIVNAVKEGFKWFTWLFKSPETKMEDVEEVTTTNAEKRYEIQEKHNSLQPLISEYDELNKKRNKSLEDLQRMAELEGQIKEIDEDLIKDNGKVDLAAANNELAQLKSDSDKLLQANLQEVKRLQSTSGVMQWLFGEETTIEALNSDTVKTVLKDSASAQLMNNNDLSAAQKQTILAQVETAIDYTTITAETNIDALVTDLTKSFTAIETFETDNLQDRVQHYAKVYNEASEEVKAQLAATYSDLNQFINGDQLKLDQQGFENLDTLGLTTTEINNLKAAWIEAGGAEDDFYNQLRTLLNSGETDPTRLVNKISHMGEGFLIGVDNVNAFGDAIVQNIGKTATETVENFMSELSVLDNFIEASEKISSGTITADELLKLQQEHPEWFTGDMYEALKSGDANYIKQATEALEQETIQQLKLNNATLQEQIIRLETEENLTDEQKAQLENYKSQLNANSLIITSIEEAGLRQSKLYQTAKKETAEQIKQNKLLHNAAELRKAIDNNKNLNIDDYDKLINTYKSLIENNNTLLNSDNMKKLQDKNAVVMVNGEYKINADAYAELYKTDRALWQWFEDNSEIIQQAYDDNLEYEEEILDISDEVQDRIQESVELQLEAQKELLEKEKETLERRKDIYNEYWDALDAEEDARERKSNRENLLQQLAALSGGNDAATSNRRKELLSQLNELDQEALDAQKQAERDALQKNIDDEIGLIEEKVSHIDETIDGLDAQFEGLTTSADALAKAAGILGTAITNLPTMLQYETTSGVTQLLDTNVPHYATGGLIKYTGPAWVDGSISKPEAFLSAFDTALIQSLVSELKATNVQGINNSSNIQIDNIIIQTNELNNDQDWTTAGKLLAAEFEAEQTKRGITQNVNRRYRR